jgi:hypothetical protein
MQNEVFWREITKAYEQCLKWNSCSCFPSVRYFVIIVLSGVRLSPHGTAATTGLLYQPQMIDDGDCRTIGGMQIGKKNQSTRRKTAQCHFVHHKSHLTRPGLERGPPRWEAND